MIDRLEQQFNKINAQQQKILKLTEALTNEQANFKPSPMQWSVAQIINHLRIAEANTNIYLRKKILDVDNLKKSTWITETVSKLMNAIMYLPIKFKAPKVVTVKNKILEMDSLSESWIDERRIIGDFLETIDEKKAQMLLFKHGAGTRLNLYQMLSWMHAHIERHNRQIQKIINSTTFPKN